MLYGIDNFYLLLIVGSVIIQLVSTIYGIKLSRVVKHVKIWAYAWNVFSISMFLVAVRRSIAVYNYLLTCPIISTVIIAENILLLIQSTLWVIFAVEMNKIFGKYFEGGDLIKNGHEKGEKGDAGPQGIQGVQGMQGIQGVAGPPGKTIYVTRDGVGSKNGNGNGNNNNNK